MADFSTPFANEAEKRNPTSSEKTGGFPCGPAEKSLFNGLFHRLEAEIGEVITFAGIAHDDAVNTKLREAIEALIAAATGGGDTSQFLLVSQARARLPIFPEILSADGRINVSSPAAGTVRIPAGVNFQHRGIYPITTVQTDFATDASKVYHVRWNSTDGYSLKDLANVVYNPSALAETNAAFDSSYDDMLIARVVTNSSNVATITNLANIDRLFYSGVLVGQNWSTPGLNGSTGDFSLDLNWSRAPKFKALTTATQLYRTSYQGGSTGGEDHDISIFAYGGSPGDATLTAYPVDRYGSRFSLMIDHIDGLEFDVSMGA